MKPTAREFPSVWYATERRVRSPTKLVVYDDKGSLRVDASSFVFEGPNGRIEVATGKIVEVALERQTLNWVIYLIIDAVIAAYLATQGWRASSILLVVAIGSGLGMLVGGNTKWVKVEWDEASGERQAAYFAHGGAFGWSGIAGATSELHDVLAAFVPAR